MLGALSIEVLLKLFAPDEFIPVVKFGREPLKVPPFPKIGFTAYKKFVEIVGAETPEIAVIELTDKLEKLAVAELTVVAFTVGALTVVALTVVIIMIGAITVLVAVIVLATITPVEYRLCLNIFTSCTAGKVAQSATDEILVAAVIVLISNSKLLKVIFTDDIVLPNCRAVTRGALPAQFWLPNVGCGLHIYIRIVYFYL